MPLGTSDFLTELTKDEVRFYLVTEGYKILSILYIQQHGFKDCLHCLRPGSGCQLRSPVQTSLRSSSSLCSSSSLRPPPRGLYPRMIVSLLLWTLGAYFKTALELKVRLNFKGPLNVIFSLIFSFFF
uniref:Uncharacterized protein n=1 Tax=Cacopsylla melanoneura TaxID=428564 RepID=A0A8D8YPU4_9HEMI